MVDFKSGDLKAILIVFIGLIVTAVLISTIADTTFTQTNTLSVENVTATVAAVNATTDLKGRTLLSTGTQDVYNQSGASITVIPNLTLITGISTTTGLQSVQLFTHDNATDLVGLSVNVTYSFEPDGYANNSGTRSITALILIFAALAMVVFILIPFIKDGSMGKLMRDFK